MQGETTSKFHFAWKIVIRTFLMSRDVEKVLSFSNCTVFQRRAWYANANKLNSMGKVNSILPHSHHMNLNWSWRRDDEHFSCEALNVELVKIFLTVAKVWVKINITSSTSQLHGVKMLTSQVLHYNCVGSMCREAGFYFPSFLVWDLKLSWNSLIILINFHGWDPDPAC